MFFELVATFCTYRRYRASHVTSQDTQAIGARYRTDFSVVLIMSELLVTSKTSI